MNIPKKPISTHRLARLTAWARLCVVWFQRVLAHLGDCIDARAALAQRTRTTADLLFITATCQLARRPLRRRTHGWLPRAHVLRDARALVAKRVRHMLRGKSVAEQAAMLARLLKHRDRVAAELLQWLLRAMRARPNHDLPGTLQALAPSVASAFGAFTASRLLALDSS